MVDSAQHIGGFDTVPPAEDDAAKSIDLNNGSNPVATPKDSPDAVSRIEAFRRLYNTSKKQTFFWVAFVCWALALDISSATTGLYLSFATSFFGQHPILSTITLLTAVMAAVIQPFWGKLADMAARPICLLLSLLLYTLGSFTLSSLIVADVTTLRNRGLAYGMVSFIYLPFAFVSSNIAAGVGLENWRWGYGMFCVMMPVCVAPILGMLFWADRKAKQQLTAEKGPAEVVKAPLANRIRRTLALVDPLGLILIGFAFSLLLCPPTLYASAVGGWSNPSMIAMEVVGGVIFILFIIWEWKFAAHPLFPLRIFKLNYLLCLFTTIMLFLVTGVYNTTGPAGSGSSRTTTSPSGLT
ncbi:uncharacterized protein EHS24_004836 [Apiotrichum porosum]|uniref:Major facilitator superfamily (MFS) profile domain-containing protein n=1 Tax=Apiotrichum porosum TaxID=105984 RepID=A0A427Y646_9TREE|nr:uncharacterized protein EHS24_004836 [Apiotrichum porosum]RSH86567.1 hypothetical protein EHS24_004836 [Apiotrichum porosum]